MNKATFVKLEKQTNNKNRSFLSDTTDILFTYRGERKSLAINTSNFVPEKRNLFKAKIWLVSLTVLFDAPVFFVLYDIPN